MREAEEGLGARGSSVGRVDGCRFAGPLWTLAGAWMGRRQAGVAVVALRVVRGAREGGEARRSGDGALVVVC